MEPSDWAFQAYALVYRLAVMAVGVLIVYWGYRLFVLGVMPTSGSEIDASAGEIRLTFKNAAPGSVFAVLGILIIAIMVGQGNPEQTETVAQTDGSSRTTTTRAGGDVDSILVRGREYELANNFGEAVSVYATALSAPSRSLGEAAPVIERLAAIRLAQGRSNEAFAFASLAHTIDPQLTLSLLIIAQVEEARGNEAAVVKALCKALKVDPTLMPDPPLARFVDRCD